MDHQMLFVGVIYLAIMVAIALTSIVMVPSRFLTTAKTKVFVVLKIGSYQESSFVPQAIEGADGGKT
jgi:hypothetical protein